jgi:cytochrome c peroxidase
MMPRLGGVEMSGTRAGLAFLVLVSGVIVTVVPACEDAGGPTRSSALSIDRDAHEERTDVARAQRAPGFGSLARVPVPLPDNLGELVADRAAAIQLGKAFYWDMQVGSDGLVACATCHHHAGADGRVKNQIRPRSPLAAGAVFFAGGPNWRPTAADFPFHRLADPNDPRSAVLFDGGSNRMASAGVVRRLFVDVRPGEAEDVGELLEDPVWNVGGVRVRRAAIVNAPSNINAVFNARQLAAGQAYDVWNGANTGGVRAPDARVVKVVGGALTPVAVRFLRASLASQAMGPPLDPTETSFAGRTFPKVGRKVLPMRPLAKQEVARDDSVLARLVDSSGRGLVGSYAALVRRAFRREWWDSSDVVVFTGGTTAERVAEGAGADAGTPHVLPNPGRPLTTDEYTAMEANFSLFWGAALMLYESTLVSDDSPFDRFLEGRARLTPAQRRGMLLFYGVRPAARSRPAPCVTRDPRPRTRPSRTSKRTRSSASSWPTAEPPFATRASPPSACARRPRARSTATATRCSDRFRSRAGRRQAAISATPSIPRSPAPSAPPSTAR